MCVGLYLVLQKKKLKFITHSQLDDKNYYDMATRSARAAFSFQINWSPQQE